MTGRILLVEDDPNDVELSLEALRYMVEEVSVINDGEQALDYLFHRRTFASRPAKPPMVMLLDLKLPKVDGVEVLRQVRSDPGLRLLPVVILTSSREEGDLIKSYQLGANAYVVKPLDFESFIAAVKELGIFWAAINEPPPSSI